ncbi:carbonic anhydrase isoform X2 [Austrofundulus limnaeus]|uniref:Carbonic anhydrase n=1 Tax=Austrofundulus limnaeus TaxID=52670 RepID=A0A2I4BNL5_AUSLI|nr:PREDICTED: carbonic anhydrase-like isoform X2 [Austrofundulus limnaeus]
MDSKVYLPSLVFLLSLVSLVKCSNWCYTGCAETPSHWEEMPGSSCGGQRQSPVNIVTSNVTADLALNDFIFVNFSSQHTIKLVGFNGHSVQCTLMDNEVEVSGGGLNGTYSATQFHFHWGDKEPHPGSEHTIDDNRYPAEMHILTIKKGVTTEEAKNQSDGFAVLGFFINGTDNGDLSGAWHTLTSTNITGSSVDVEVSFNFSIDDLLGDVNRKQFYRYHGSLTTPDCDEAVVWTIFHEPIQVPHNLINRFSENTDLVNNFRPAQPLYGRKVTASPATPLPPVSEHHWCYDSHCYYSPPQWSEMPDSYCGGQSQSPINIDTHSVVMDNTLGSFTFKNFDKGAINYITNTGHTVECVLKDNMVEVSGGGLKHAYSTLQLHFHWGTKAANSEGSEHTVDSHRYPMELHIVSKRKDLTLKEALQTSDGLAVLGFFIEDSQSSKRITSSSGVSSSDMRPWTKLTSYFSAIQNISSQVKVTDVISIDDLLGSVNRDSYYRYSGSLTTPSCNEAVVWTVFKDTVKLDHNLMMMFPKYTTFQDIYRPIQSVNNRKIYSTSAAEALRSILLYPLLGCLFALVP